MDRLTPTSSPKRSSTLPMTLENWFGTKSSPFGADWFSASMAIVGERVREDEMKRKNGEV